MSEAILRIIDWALSRGTRKMREDDNEKEDSRTVTFSRVFLLVGWIIVLIALLLSPGGLFGRIFPLH
jgi:hypothetical protein